ncbi:MAG: hypothetical protein NTV32_07355 [Gammaproteobacteria bacterium]|jgi:hypothetical protein|nr:hypothetical protein [Gammaproteobacteria bacterium]
MEKDKFIFTLRESLPIPIKKKGLEQQQKLFFDMIKGKSRAKKGVLALPGLRWDMNGFDLNYSNV